MSITRHHQKLSCSCLFIQPSQFFFQDVQTASSPSPPGIKFNQALNYDTPTAKMTKMWCGRSAANLPWDLPKTTLRKNLPLGVLSGYSSFLMAKNHCKLCSEGIILATSNSSPNVTIEPLEERRDSPPPIHQTNKKSEDWDIKPPQKSYVVLARSTAQTLSTWQIQFVHLLIEAPELNQIWPQLSQLSWCKSALSQST